MTDSSKENCDSTYHQSDNSLLTEFSSELQPEPEDSKKNLSDHPQSSEKKLEKTQPTIYPDIEFVNRTLP